MCKCAENAIIKGKKNSFEPNLIELLSCHYGGVKKGVNEKERLHKIGVVIILSNVGFVVNTFTITPNAIAVFT